MLVKAVPGVTELVSLAATKSRMMNNVKLHSAYCGSAWITKVPREHFLLQCFAVNHDEWMEDMEDMIVSNERSLLRF